LGDSEDEARRRVGVPGDREGSEIGKEPDRVLRANNENEWSTIAVMQATMMALTDRKNLAD
jgi:hypothetical protein